MKVFINDVASFLPNEAVTNENIEKILGKINNVSSRVKDMILRNNQISTRYYAIDPQTGMLTHTNADLVSEAVRNLKPKKDFDINSIQCLCCGTSSPDLLLPGHALMVLGELGIPSCEAVTTAGVCMSGMTALKYAYMNVAMGMSNNAVATGSELSSSVLRAKFYNREERTDSVDIKIEIPNNNDLDISKTPQLAFNADFLRWMLSDGAGACYLSGYPNVNGISLEIEWIDNVSYAGENETCQYMGGTKLDSGKIVGWRAYDQLDEQQRAHIMAIKQDIKLLNNEVVQSAIFRALKDVVKKHNLKPEDIDWYLPHYSSGYFRPIIFKYMQEIDFEIPYEKWFTNLHTKGNTGSASIYIILEELFKSGKLKIGERLLCFIPESGRFSHCYMMLKVV